jgi:hypothetical protein
MVPLYQLRSLGDLLKFILVINFSRSVPVDYILISTHVEHIEIMYLLSYKDHVDQYEHIGLRSSRVPNKTLAFLFSR